MRGIEEGAKNIAGVFGTGAFVDEHGRKDAFAFRFKTVAFGDAFLTSGQSSAYVLRRDNGASAKS